VHLKSLTLKGFKSFASATTLRFEPGITCVVGPNGSGKSNVVDALTWVMGEQGAKALRGGKMEDVIFAGTAGRAPLGRAEVTLTIDNADGALAIEHAEVSITRRMFRDGASEYEINGAGCRLMDVQELLSDSGIGREMHVIVGQGRLAGILESRPEDRRAFIEEAAGVLKHRKRKEKALRKLDSMQANLARLADLTTELRRQLKPLGRQAEVARRAQTVQADLRDARLRLAADDLVTRRAELAAQQADETTSRAEQERVRAALDAAEAALAQGEAAVAELAPAARAGQDTWFRLSALSERVGATTRVAAERARHLGAPAGPERHGRDPAELDAEAERSAALEAELATAVEVTRAALGGAQAHRAELERILTTAEREHLAAVRAVADRREGLARLSGQVDTLRSRTESRAAEVERLSAAVAEARERGAAAQATFDDVQAQVGALDEGEVDLDDTHEQAVAAHGAARARVAELVAAERSAEQEVASGRARVEALSLGLTRRDGAAWLLEHGSTGLVGSAAQLLQVEPGFEVAVAAALGPAADAVVVNGTAAALGSLRALKTGDGGRAGLLLQGAVATVARPELPAGARWAAELVRCAPALRGAVDGVLEDVAVVDDLAAASALVAARPGLRAVTPDGDLLGAGWAAGGSDRAPSTLEVQASVNEAVAALASAEQRAQGLDAALRSARAEETARAGAAEQALAALNASDAALAAVAEQLGTLGQAVRSASAEVARLTTQRAELEERRDTDVAALEDLVDRLGRVRAEPGEHEPSTDARDAAATELTAARAVEVEARLEQRTAEERAGAQRGRAEGLRRAAATEREARARAEVAQRTRAHAAAVAAAVVTGGERTQARLQEVLVLAAAERDAVAARRASADAELAGARAQVQGLRQQVATLTDTVHRDEVARTQAALRTEQLEQSIGEQLGISLDELVAEFGPDVPLPPSAVEVDEYETARERGEQVTAPAPLPFERAAQQRRAAAAEKDLALLGRVNPLALEEFAALEERHAFLATQLQDVKDTRRDLLGVVADVDARILEVFTAAYTDVAREFGAVFETLFPGGEGRLVLTDPDDMLTTGIEVEARPPGKKVKRLSLLSGGEKSLTAVAMLVAIFRARPSPFYVMDEVEAALDDTNLQRLITLFTQLREKSQLIVITHQKATMEVADALYGVSMRGDGITTVISQRLRGQDLGTPPVVVDPDPARS
jgi:chromosome segregation protein